MEDITRKEILELMGQGVAIITGNNRLASVLRERYEQKQMRAGQTVWPTPRVMPWSSWILTIAEEGLLAGHLPKVELLLSAQQEQCLWEDIITASAANDPLLQTSGMVRRAQEAWQLLHAWRLPLKEKAFRYNQDSQTFHQWASALNTLCVQRKWLTMALLPDVLAEGIKAHRWTLPAELILIGFDELTPQQQMLIEALAQAGCHVRWLRMAGVQAMTARIQCNDARQETMRVACWIRHRLEENSTASIGVVVQDLATQRDVILQNLDNVLTPKALLPGQQYTQRPYNISLGQPLDVYPIIGIAWKILGLLNPVISLKDAGQLLRSPFIFGWQEEAGQRAMLDARLRESGEINISLRSLLYQSAQTRYACPIFAQRLKTALQTAADLPEQDTASAWPQRLTHLLSSMGWAQGRVLSSEEYQTTEAWHDLLSAFNTLEPVVKTMPVTTALSRLRSMAKERTFQPQSESAPVQIIGMLESIGLEFDHLWVMGLHDAVWPATPKPNPFIPLPMQRNAAMPRASESRELQVSRTITKRLFTSAAEVIASYPHRNGEEELRPSPLIRTLPEIDWQDLAIQDRPTWREAVRQSAQLVAMTADLAPQLETELTRGGSAVFKLQALCPFRAFAEIRLGAYGLGQSTIGLSAMARGTLVHTVLEKVWAELVSHEQLVKAQPAWLSERVSAHVNGALSEIASRYPQTLTPRLRQLEMARLNQQIMEWLEIEKQRAPFTVIENEGKHTVAAGGVEVTVKIDRIDQLDDGGLVVIDYKTGSVNPAQWFGERPDEPQLPLYSLAVEKNIAGLVFAQVKTGVMAFKGVLEDSEIVPGVKSYKSLNQSKIFNAWQEILDHWRDTLTALGNEFRSGHAEVHPKQDACQWCELQSLCRIHEISAQQDEATET